METRKLIAVLLISFVILSVSTVIFAETTDPTPDTDLGSTQTPPPITDTQVTNATITPEDQTLAAALAKTYGIPVTAQDIANLHATGIGYGEISKAYGCATLSGKSVSDILEMKQTMGWGEIAKTLGFKVSDITRKDEAVQHAQKETKDNQKTAASKQNANPSNHAANGNSGGNSSGHSGGNGGGRH